MIEKGGKGMIRPHQEQTFLERSKHNASQRLGGGGGGRGGSSEGVCWGKG